MNTEKETRNKGISECKLGIRYQIEGRYHAKPDLYLRQQLKSYH